MSPSVLLPVDLAQGSDEAVSAFAVVVAEILPAGQHHFEHERFKRGLAIYSQLLGFLADLRGDAASVLAINRPQACAQEKACIRHRLHANLAVHAGDEREEMLEILRFSAARGAVIAARHLAPVNVEGQ